MDSHFNILVATDYSVVALHAERYAIQLAKQTQSAIRFVHVFTPRLQGTALSFNADKINYDPVKYEHDKLCDHVSALLRAMDVQQDEINYKCIVREGISIQQQIHEEANESDINLVVAGTHGASGIREKLFGNHAWQMIKHAGCPVLLIPGHAAFTGIKKIAFATEYREDELHSLPFVIQLCKSLHASLTVVHITNDVLPKEFELSLFNSFRMEVRRHLTGSPMPHMQIEFHEHVKEGLNAYCLKEKTDWLILSHEHITLLDKILYPYDRGLTMQMSLVTATPLYVLPNAYDEAHEKRMREF